MWRLIGLTRDGKRNEIFFRCLGALALFNAYLAWSYPTLPDHSVVQAAVFAIELGVTTLLSSNLYLWGLPLWFSSLFEVNTLLYLVFTAGRFSATAWSFVEMAMMVLAALLVTGVTGGDEEEDDTTDPLKERATLLSGKYLPHS